ncbi:hypothetical protein CMI42_01235 [Candidatus Pacearchaeota archaeon]|nr:hypothetical protein [Candidatus Pacearchaeota archaeon]
MYEDKLQKLGLTGGEARIYSALLKLGSSTVGPIVKESGVAYSKIYEVLQRLIEKGLASYTIKEKTKYFQSLEPKRIEDYLDKQEVEIQEKKNILQEILPFLNKISSDEETQEVEMFIGEKGITTAYDILLDKTNRNSILRFFYLHDPSYDDRVYDFYYGRVNYNRKKLNPILKSKKIVWRGIINKENLKKELGKPPKNIDQKYTKLPVPGNIDITDNTILITVWSSKPLGILIQSKEVAKNFQKYFDSLWKLIK